MPAGRTYRRHRLKRRFLLLHPGVMMAFFVGVIVVTLLSYHPLILGLSFVFAAASVIYYLGVKVLGRSLMRLGPMTAIVVVFNTVFNRRGATELFTTEHLQMTFTLESLLFGLSIALMLTAVILWFRLYQELMTSDRFLYLFAPIAPTFALSVTMVQRWIPLTKYRWQQIRDAHKPSRFAAIRSLTHSLSALMSWSMEDAIQAADSMQARGYSKSSSSNYGKNNQGKGAHDTRKRRRSSFRYFPFTTYDAIALTVVILLAVTAGLAVFFSARELAFFPVYRGVEYLSATALIAVTLLMFFPLLLEGGEQLRWRLSAQKT
ncbi:MAG: energy-coupling factor transporter transmembrane protein EcfT [Coriobacteriia bacterium]|nr:energy-coupling factor transporter transmembrane protein EcfT [Coriobacteriia bacterium]